MAVGRDGRIIEERAPTAIGDTASVPEGTMVTAPAASPTGPTPTGPTGVGSPVVAVNTTVWYKDATLMSTIVGGLLALEPVIEDALRQQTFNWKSFTLSCILALAAWLRNRTNSVVR